MQEYLHTNNTISACCIKDLITKKTRACPVLRITELLILWNHCTQNCNLTPKPRQKPLVCPHMLKPLERWNSKGFLVELLTRVELVTSSLPKRANGVADCVHLLRAVICKRWNFNCFRNRVAAACCTFLWMIIECFQGVSSFFWSFFTSIITCTLVVTIILGIFTNNYYEKKAYNYICFKVIKIRNFDV